MSNPVIVSTDGSALRNPNGPMGWAWANHMNGTHDAGGATNGTNQIGELCAVLEALRSHHDAPELIIETDSQYAINCSSTWVHNWKRNGWRNAAKKPVKNVELIKAIDAEMTARPGKVSFVWVKGHAGNEFNEIVDDLARGYAGDAQAGKKEGHLPLEGWQSLLSSEYRKGLKVPADIQRLLDGGDTGDAQDTQEAVVADATGAGTPIETALPPTTANAPATTQPTKTTALASPSAPTRAATESAEDSAPQQTPWRIDPNQPALFEFDDPEPATPAPTAPTAGGLEQDTLF